MLYELTGVTLSPMIDVSGFQYEAREGKLTLRVPESVEFDGLEGRLTLNLNAPRALPAALSVNQLRAQALRLTLDSLPRVILKTHRPTSTGMNCRTVRLSTIDGDDSRIRVTDSKGRSYPLVVRMGRVVRDECTPDRLSVMAFDPACAALIGRELVSIEKAIIRNGATPTLKDLREAKERHDAHLKRLESRYRKDLRLAVRRHVRRPAPPAELVLS